MTDRTGHALVRTVSCIEIVQVKPVMNRVGDWPKQSVSDALKPALFDPINNEDAGCFVILDAALLDGLSTYIQHHGLNHACLFDGETLPRDASPWLLELPPDGNFTRRLFTDDSRKNGWWSRHQPVFLRSTAALQDLRRHLRKFTRQRDQDGQWVIVRFWDGWTALHYTKALAQQPKRLSRWMGDGALTINRIVCRADNDWFQIEPSTTEMVSAPESGQIQLGEDEARVFRAALYRRFLRETADWLQDSLPTPIARVHRTAFVERQSARALQLGLSGEYAVSRVVAACWMTGQELPSFPEDALRQLQDHEAPEDLRADKFLARADKGR